MANVYKKKQGFSKISQLSYLAGYEIKSRFSQRFKNPLICSFKITGRCNLKCRHCPFWKEKTIEEMGFKEVCRILEELHSIGVKIVIFEGGEPLLWKDDELKKNISDVIDYAKNLFFYIGVTTNGTLDLKNLNPDADIIFVSIDGLEKTHDGIRGKSFDVIIKNIEACAGTRKIIANTCISKTNAHDVKGLIKFLNDKVYGITIQFFYPYKNVADIMLSHKQKENVLNELLDLKRSGYRILDSWACLEQMAYNTWKCADFLVCSVEKTGSVSFGCYLKNKVEKVVCADCGFAIHCEISLAYRLNFSAIKSAAGIFWGKI